MRVHHKVQSRVQVLLLKLKLFRPVLALSKASWSISASSFVKQSTGPNKNTPVNFFSKVCGKYSESGLE